MALTPELCKEFMDLIYSIKKQNEEDKKLSIEVLKELFVNEEIDLQTFTKSINDKLNLTYSQQSLLNEKLVLIASQVIEDLKEKCKQ